MFPCDKRDPACNQKLAADWGFLGRDDRARTVIYHARHIFMPLPSYQSGTKLPNDPGTARRSLTRWGEDRHVPLLCFIHLNWNLGVHSSWLPVMDPSRKEVPISETRWKNLNIRKTTASGLPDRTVLVLRPSSHREHKLLPYYKQTHHIIQ